MLTRRDGGLLQVIGGTMKSGKSGGLIDELTNLQFAHQTSQGFKPKTDERSAKGFIESENGSRFPAVEIPTDISRADFLAIIHCREAQIGKRLDVIGLDEGQFFPADSDVYRTLIELANTGYRVIVAGLPLDFLKRPFGMMPNLIAQAEKYTLKLAICTVCGQQNAIYPQRFIDGQLAPREDSQIAVDKSQGARGIITYQARCRHDFVDPPSIEELRMLDMLPAPSAQ